MQVQGELERGREGVALLTVHGVGSSYRVWLDWAAQPALADLRRRAVFLHCCLPGQQPGAVDLPADYVFPSMEVRLDDMSSDYYPENFHLQTIGLNLVTVLDSLRVGQVVALGEGAGADIVARFAMHHPTRLHAALLLNPESVGGSNSYKEMIIVSLQLYSNLPLHDLPGQVSGEEGSGIRGVEQQVGAEDPLTYCNLQFCERHSSYFAQFAELLLLVAIKIYCRTIGPSNKSFCLVRTKNGSTYTIAA